MSKRTANLIVISSHTEISPAFTFAPQLALRQSEDLRDDWLRRCARICDLRPSSLAGGESHRGSDGAATDARHVCRC